MSFHSFRSQWYITFLNTLLRYNQTSHFKDPRSDFLLRAQPWLSSLDTPALSSASDAAASSRHTRAIAYIRTAALCLTEEASCKKNNKSPGERHCAPATDFTSQTWFGVIHRTCLPPQRVEVIDLSSLHLFFVLLWQVQQVGNNLMEGRNKSKPRRWMPQFPFYSVFKKLTRLFLSQRDTISLKFIQIQTKGSSLKFFLSKPFSQSHSLI